MSVGRGKVRALRDDHADADNPSPHDFIPVEKNRWRFWDTLAGPQSVCSMVGKERRTGSTWPTVCNGYATVSRCVEKFK
jgi:hypothetical protein